MRERIRKMGKWTVILGIGVLSFVSGEVMVRVAVALYPNHVAFGLSLAFAGALMWCLGVNWKGVYGRRTE